MEDKDIKDLIMIRINEVCIKIRKFYPSFEQPKISFNLKGRRAGTAGSHYIRYNLLMAKYNLEDFLENTVPHELVHSWDFQEFGNSNHGKRWKNLMGLIGIENATTSHHYDISNVVPGFPYVCDCPGKVHHVSKNRYNKILKGHNYFCKKCKVEIKEK